MISFHALYITPDKKHLVVDVSIDNLAYYNDVYLDSIVIDTQSTFIETGPTNDAFYVESFANGFKHKRLFIDIDTLSDNLFFVWVNARGTVAEDTPCGISPKTVLGIVFDKDRLYSQAMKLINSLDSCAPNDGLIDFILRKNAFDLSLSVGNYTQAIEYWNQFYKDIKSTKPSHCSCHGILR